MQTDKQETLAELFDRAGDFVLRHDLWKNDSRVIAAVSGGADSMALLLFLLHCRKEQAQSVGAVHVNHGLRGEAADRDERFVRSFCEQHDVPLTVYKLQPGENDRSEQWAREERYRCFEKLAAEKEALIATAHTLNDQAETLLFRLARGSGVKGAGGIPPQRACFVRPLLLLTRQDTETICRLSEVGYCTDESNLQDTYARNRIRHYALPALIDANEGALESIGRFCERMRQTEAFLNRQTSELLQRAQTEQSGIYDPRVLLQAGEPLLGEALRGMLPEGSEPEERHIRLMEKVLKGELHAVQLSRSLVFRRNGPYVELQEKKPERPQKTQAPQEIPFQTGDLPLWQGYLLRTRLVSYESFKKTGLIEKKHLNSVADYDKITKLILTCRTRQSGDTFSPVGRKVNKSIKKWFCEWKIPTEERNCLPMIACGNRVIWLWGRGFAEGFRPDEHTKTLLQVLQP